MTLAFMVIIFVLTFVKAVHFESSADVRYSDQRSVTEYSGKGVIVHVCVCARACALTLRPSS